MDGSTDRTKVENELVVVLYCQKDDAKESCARYFTVIEPNKADADGLILCLGKALQSMGVEDILDSGCILGVRGHPVLVGGDTDGASVNISEQNGMRGKLQRIIPWLFSCLGQLKLSLLSLLFSKL